MTPKPGSSAPLVTHREVLLLVLLYRPCNYQFCPPSWATTIQLGSWECNQSMCCRLGRKKDAAPTCLPDMGVSDFRRPCDVDLFSDEPCHRSTASRGVVWSKLRRCGITSIILGDFILCKFTQAHWIEAIHNAAALMYTIAFPVKQKLFKKKK